eukprot:GHVS01068909.1.p1 GENE.GHVS01068909.1~~GHVS01068909.1.p1  ORF type:complete len:121 (+),score=12.74 GHVS01068909.1:300-662(+)
MKEFATDCQTLGIKLFHSSVGYPEGNGVAESFHRYFKHAVQICRQTYRCPLPTAVGWAIIAYQATPHPSTGETPGYLMFGTDVVIPGLQQFPTCSKSSRAMQLEVLAAAREALLRRYVND